jgi:hypothetical protein
MNLPPSVHTRPTTVDVSVFTAGGATVQVTLPRSCGLHEIPEEQVIGEARILARAALQFAMVALER